MRYGPHAAASIVFLGASIAMSPVCKAQTATDLTGQFALDTSLKGPNYDSAFTLNMTDLGHGENGPQTAHTGASLNCLKANFPATNAVSENDCVNIVLRQDGPQSDGSGILINAQDTGRGFINGTEMAISSLNPSANAITLGMDVQLGSINLGSQMYGASFNATQGVGTTAIFVQASQGAGWTNAFQAVNSSGQLYFQVDGQGNVTTTGDARVGGAVFVNGVLQASATKLDEMTGARTVEVSDCGTTLRSLSDQDVSLAMVGGLPVGCRIGIIQAGKGAVRIAAGPNLHEERARSAGAEQQTAYRYALAEILVDSGGSFLVLGDTVDTPARSARAYASLGGSNANIRQVSFR